MALAAGQLTGILSLLSGCETKEKPAGFVSDTVSPVQNFNGERPNFIVIYADDLGYGDIGCYGNKIIRTPNIDSLSEQGARFTDYCACAPVCAPSRAGLLTGRYPFRSGVIGNPYPEDEPIDKTISREIGNALLELGVLDLREENNAPGLPQDEITLSEALKTVGYRTGMIGKWHLGDYSKQPEFNPIQHGFDQYLGLPHSNDMFPCPLYRNDQQLEADIGLNQSRLTGMYTKEAIRFIEGSKGDPFFLYLAHTFPHQPLFASEKFDKKSKAGKFGDAVEELDWSVGEIVRCLGRNGLDRNTIVVFTSDNGPWYEGSSGILRGRKGQTYEGGFRVPFIAWWPERIPAGCVCNAPVMNIDLFPTFLKLAGVESPKDRIIDGKDILTQLTGKSNVSPHDALYFHHYDLVEGVRTGKWKYVQKMHRYTWPAPLDSAKVIDTLGKKQLGNRWPLLYDLENDPGEHYNVINTHPEVANKLQALITRWEKHVADNPRGKI